MGGGWSFYGLTNSEVLPPPLVNGHAYVVGDLVAQIQISVVYVLKVAVTMLLNQYCMVKLC